ncbi:hypothetical protein CPB84DRAFT_1785318 [Gymnopilus junonius]|uniref:Zinc transporter 6 n=1 Tax=Gymnopilus junonius TaxID=109634 RepID=A0A9P5NJ60_GYMJU|nr:hypothetical protein CPB84DRAFT_1785318 [Gymnopilus junonius]
MSVQTQQIHRRKSSKDEDEINSTPISQPSNVEVTLTVPEQHDLPSVTLAPPPRNRVHSAPLQSQYGHSRTPSSPNTLPPPSSPSPSPFRTNFQPMSMPPRQLNGHGHPMPITSPFRSTFSGTMGPPQMMNGHSRTRSISTPFSPALPSPLSSSFPPSSMSSSGSPPNSALPPYLSPSQSAPENLQNPNQNMNQNGEAQVHSPQASASTAAKHARRHSRMHSRNLSVFFPRPESLSHRTISEDGDPEGGQEITIPTSNDEVEAQVIPAAGSSVSIPGRDMRRNSSHGHSPITPLGQGFTFGARPPPGVPMPDSDGDGNMESMLTAPPMSLSLSGSSTSSSTSATSTTSTSKKRGHHHKHSLSHNFFSFLEPGTNGALNSREEELHTLPTPIPVSPWGPISAIPPDSAAPSKTSFGFGPGSGSGSAVPSPVPSPLTMNGHAHPHHTHPHPSADPRISPGALTVSLAQFTLGAWLWVTGQQVGSLACTGLGYWIVFDAFGVALAGVVPGWLAAGSRSGPGMMKEREKIRRPYGNGRLETVLMFAQAVYLLFSSVYVCKETVEHVLLSAGEGQGHHHHHGDEEEGFGIDFPIFMTFITFVSLFATALIFENNTKIVHIAGNRIPSIPTLLRSIWSPSRNHHLQDAPPTTRLGLLVSNPFVASPLLFCAGIVGIALVLPPAQHRSADLVLASLIALVTFQVAYRACVVLGAVLLQTSPSRGLANGKMEAFLRAMRSYASPLPLSSSASSKSSSSLPSASASLVITLELHVREGLGDEDVLKLTRWAWERCVSAIISGYGGAGGGGTGGSVNLRDVKEMGEDGPGVPEVTVGVVRG